MRRDKVNTIVSIGNGLCRVIVRSEKLARRLGRIPGVTLREDDAENLGWWVIFQEELRPIIEPVFEKDHQQTVQGRGKRLVQSSLFDDLRDHPDGDKLWAAETKGLDSDGEDEEDDDGTHSSRR
ncbi:MAG TPA: hypothetical protein ENN56_03400 [Firmicutes bacterium]|nr:hypothetical protein [Bacillota bacterium]